VRGSGRAPVESVSCFQLAGLIRDRSSDRSFIQLRQNAAVGGAKSTRIEVQIQGNQLIEWDPAQTPKEADCLLRRVEFQLSGDFRNVPLT
jgi:hypothetical protein